MPVLNCLNCGGDIHLDAADYSWYSGEVECEHCASKMEVKIGDWEITYTIYGERISIPRTRPFRSQYIVGGKLLSQPIMVRVGPPRTHVA